MHTVQSFAQLAGVSLVAGVWQGFVLVSAVWLCLRLAPRTSAALRFAIWAVVFSLVALLPLAESLHLGHASSASGRSVIAVDLRWSMAIAWIWFALTACRSVRFGFHAAQLWSLERRSTVVTPSERCAALLTVGERKVLLCTSNEIERPSVSGFFTPRVLVPAWLFAQLSESELEQILLHEMEHLRRGDDWLNLLQKLGLMLLPLNPILMWVERRLCFERELACDDGVLLRTNAPRAYATCLTRLAERGLDRRVLSLALGALERQSQLTQRVHRILRREALLTPMQSRMITGAFAVGLLGCAAWLVRCPQLISFATPQPTISAAVRLPERAPVAAGYSAAARPALAENVVYQEPRVARPVLLKASLPSKALAARPAKALQGALVSPVRRASTHPKPTKEWVMLTSWPEGDHRRMVLPVVATSNFFHPYAAVRVDGGWLIVQL